MFLKIFFSVLLDTNNFKKGKHDELQSFYCIHFWREKYEPHYPASSELYSTTTNQLIGLVGRMFANGLGDLCSIPGPTKDFKNGTWYLLD